MPTYAQLQSEASWIAEFTPPNLTTLMQDLRNHFGVGADAVGSKGDNDHLYGYHRSRNWVLNSVYSAYGDGDYSVQVLADHGGDGDWLAAVDVNPGSTDELIAMCQRLDTAVQAGQVPQLREWFGNLDGDQVVDGWDLVQDRAASSDSSHLWHLHMSFLRSHADDDHTLLFQVLTGTEPAPITEEDEMSVKLINVNNPGHPDHGKVFKVYPTDLGMAREHLQHPESLGPAVALYGGQVDVSDPDDFGTPIEDLRAKWAAMGGGSGPGVLKVELSGTASPAA